jgi:hypothetical protein
MIWLKKIIQDTENFYKKAINSLSLIKTGYETYQAGEDISEEEYNYSDLINAANSIYDEYEKGAKLLIALAEKYKAAVTIHTAFPIVLQELNIVRNIFISKEPLLYNNNIKEFLEQIELSLLQLNKQALAKGIETGTINAEKSLDKYINDKASLIETEEGHIYNPTEPIDEGVESKYNPAIAETGVEKAVQEHIRKLNPLMEGGNKIDFNVGHTIEGRRSYVDKGKEHRTEAEILKFKLNRFEEKDHPAIMAYINSLLDLANKEDNIIVKEIDVINTRAPDIINKQTQNAKEIKFLRYEIANSPARTKQEKDLLNANQILLNNLLNEKKTLDALYGKIVNKIKSEDPQIQEAFDIAKKERAEAAEKRDKIFYIHRKRIHAANYGIYKEQESNITNELEKEIIKLKTRLASHYAARDIGLDEANKLIIKNIKYLESAIENNITISKDFIEKIWKEIDIATAANIKTKEQIKLDEAAKERKLRESGKEERSIPGLLEMMRFQTNNVVSNTKKLAKKNYIRKYIESNKKRIYDELSNHPQIIPIKKEIEKSSQEMISALQEIKKAIINKDKAAQKNAEIALRTAEGAQKAAKKNEEFVIKQLIKEPSLILSKDIQQEAEKASEEAANNKIKEYSAFKNIRELIESLTKSESPGQNPIIPEQGPIENKNIPVVKNVINSFQTLLNNYNRESAALFDTSNIIIKTLVSRINNEDIVSDQSIKESRNHYARNFRIKVINNIIKQSSLDDENISSLDAKDYAEKFTIQLIDRLINEMISTYEI